MKKDFFQRLKDFVKVEAVDEDVGNVSMALLCIAHRTLMAKTSRSNATKLLRDALEKLDDIST